MSTHFDHAKQRREANTTKNNIARTVMETLDKNTSKRVDFNYKSTEKINTFAILNNNINLYEEKNYENTFKFFEDLMDYDRYKDKDKNIQYHHDIVDDDIGYLFYLDEKKYNEFKTHSKSKDIFSSNMIESELKDGTIYAIGATGINGGNLSIDNITYEAIKKILNKNAPPQIESLIKHHLIEVHEITK